MSAILTMLKCKVGEIREKWEVLFNERPRGNDLPTRSWESNLSRINKGEHSAGVEFES